MSNQVNQQANLIFLSNVRLSFPWIVDPQVKKNDAGVETRSYNCDFILSPQDPGYQKFMQTYAAMAAEKWKENAQNAMGMIHADRKNRCYGDGAERINKKTFQSYDGYAGNAYLSARSSRQPQIIRLDGTTVDPANTMELRAVASKLYGGCFVNAVIKPWLQQNDKGLAVRADLIAIQFAKDGDAFGAGAADVTGMFGAVAGAAPQGFAPVAAPQMPAVPFPGQPAAPSFAPQAPQMPSFFR